MEAGVDADSEEEAFSATKRILDRHTAGVTHAVRMGPEVRSEKDHASQKTNYMGYVRFCFRDEPGGKIELQNPAPIKYISD